MKLFRIEDSPLVPVTHSPELKKRVLSAEGFSCLKNLSHVVMPPGATAFEHVHERAWEVFYCLRGSVTFRVNGEDVHLEGGQCLAVGPGDRHSVTGVKAETELFYFFAETGLPA